MKNGAAVTLAAIATRAAGLGVIGLGVWVSSLLLAMPAAAWAGNYTLTYSFKGGNDGANPMAGLIDLDGTFYGTTEAGGAADSGTVFALTQGGGETVLHAFAGGNDGAYPWAGLTAIGSVLYGTTLNGGGGKGCGAEGCGTVFTITPGGAERVLYGFAAHGGDDGNDGVNPFGGLLNLGNVLYGTTFSGGGADCAGADGTDGCGTVFALTPGGKLKTLYAFGGGKDGAGPRVATGLIAIEGALYGTTYFGGDHPGCGKFRCGSVFALQPGGGARQVHAFSGDNDGAYPWAGLTYGNGMLYGTTYFGGGRGVACGPLGCGMVFALAPDGHETVLYRFKGDNDGYAPLANVLCVGGVLYGTTAYGGAYGGGTVFALTLDGHETVLHSFGSSGDGSHPVAGLIMVNGTLYGTTQSGGAHGHGTVFGLTP